MPSPFARSVRRASSVAVLVAVAIVCFVAAASTQRQRFYTDDPIAREPESQDASKAAPYDIRSIYEMSYNLFVVSGYKPSGRRAENVNTIDEVPDSNWFTNRIGTTPITPEQMTRGANVGAPPDPSRWVLTREKTAGVHPGFTARDAKGETWFLEFDPPYYAEGATGAVAVATKIFWALGYNQVESFITTFDPNKVEFDPKATIRRPSGERTRFSRDDMNSILERVAKRPDGTYRVIAGRLLPGRVLGGFRFEGTRPDDPNDVVPHERRRELRALRVFGAWTNLTDLKAANTLDSILTENGRAYIKHYLQDVGSTFGMCNELHEWDLSYEHFYQTDTTMKRLASFGFDLSPWQTIPYPEYYPSIGKFEGERFDPRKWRPQTPTTAYAETRYDDAFWAARRIAAFSDDLIRAAVRAGQYSDPKAEKYLGDVLIKRRGTILRVYLTAVNPIVNPRLDTSGRMTFDNAAIAAGAAKGEPTYRASWMLFDNMTGATKPLSTTESRTPSLDAPAGLPTTPGTYIEVDISADFPAYPSWKEPIKTYFRRTEEGWTLVGLERLPEMAPFEQTLEAGSH
jgi:DNA-binding phage protein